MIQKGYKKSFKSRRKRIYFKKILLGFVFLAFISGSIYLFFFSSYFKIKEISVTSKEIAKEDITNSIRSEIEITRNIFFANTGKASEILRVRFPKIDNVQIKRNFPNRVAVTIEERKPIATLEFKGEYFNLDKKGIAFEKIPFELVYLPLIKIQPGANELKEGEAICSPENAAKLEMVINKFAGGLKIEVESIEIVSDYRVNVKTKEGWKTYLNFAEDIAWQMEKLNTLLKEKIPPEGRIYLNYIDLRFDKVYVFPEISKLKNPAEK